ncbi:MAG: YlbF family regulator [Phycisphaerae bacterium]
MEDIIADAQALGKKIADHPRMKAFMAAARAVAENEAAQATLKKYQELTEKIRRLEFENKPIEVEDKHALAEAEAEVAGDDLLKRMMKCQTDYVEMMQHINRAIDEASAAAYGAG